MNLRERRKAEGLSQLAVSVASGVPHYFLGAIEAGKLVPTLNQLERLAEVFGCEPNDLPESNWKIVGKKTL